MRAFPPTPLAASPRCAARRRSLRLPPPPRTAAAPPPAPDGPPATLRDLEVSLGAAVAAEDYAGAAALRDRLRFLRRDAVQGVEAANAAFYAAFAEMDYAAMARLWGRGDSVRCTHPGAALIQGRDAVLASWAHVFRRGGRMAVRVERLQCVCAGTAGVGVARGWRERQR